MKKVTIQAYEDRSRTEGGHAVILLQGITEPKGLVAFRIRPMDAARGHDGNGGWIGGEHLPVTVTNTDYGLEIVAGPDVTESEVLLPGTVVEFQIPSSGVRGEFLWPNIAPLMRPKRKTIAIVKPRQAQRNPEVAAETSATAVRAAIANPTPVASAEPGQSLPPAPASTPDQAPVPAAAQTQSSAMASSSADPFPYPMSATEPVAAPSQSARNGDSAEPAAKPAPQPKAPDAVAFPFPAGPAAASAASLGKTEPTKPADEKSYRPASPAVAAPTPKPAAATVSQRATQQGEVHMDRSNAGPHQALTPEEQQLESEIGDKYGWAFKKDLSIMLSKKFFALGASRHDDVQDEAIRATHHKSDHHNIAAEATAILAHHEEDHTPAPVTDYVPAAANGAAGTTYTGGYAGAYNADTSPALSPALITRTPEFPFAAGPSAPRAATPEATAPARTLAENAMAAALLGLVAAGIAGIVMLSSGGKKTGAGSAAPSLTAALAAPVNPPASDALYQALIPAAATSPRGQATAGVSAEKALETANRLLLANSASRDAEEGAFWLKQYITGTLADTRTLRVLTQLGSVYAEPATGSPDYAKSRLVWEISGAAGDPVAMCFLGLLHENGLGVAADKATALQWYERAKEKGGCPSIDEQIARLKK